MNAKAKLKIRHIEDADKSKAANISTGGATDEPAIALSRVSEVRTVEEIQPEPTLRADVASNSAVGEKLRRERLAMDLSIRDVAQQLRIQKSYLEALESGDFDNLPGLTYAIGYVRSYAQFVGLEQEPLIQSFKAEAKKLQEPTQLSFPSPAPEGKVPGGALLFVGVLLAAISYGGWYYFSTSGTSVSDLAPAIPDRLAFLLEEPAIDKPEPMLTPAKPESAPSATATSSGTPAEKNPTTAAVPATSQPVTDTETGTDNATDTAEATPPAEVISPSSEAPEDTSGVTDATAETPETEPASTVTAATTTTNKPVQSAPDASATEASATTEPAQGASAPVTQPTPAAPEIPAVPSVTRASTPASMPSAVDAEAAAIDSQTPKPAAVASALPKIVISATDDSWVQVRGEDATPLMTRILRKGESYDVPARPGLKLFTGNAGALKVTVNGATIPALGPFGKIARNVPLDSSLLTYTATD